MYKSKRRIVVFREDSKDVSSGDFGAVFLEFWRGRGQR